jgi:hypothetical protein
MIENFRVFWKLFVIVAVADEFFRHPVITIITVIILAGFAVLLDWIEHRYPEIYRGTDRPDHPDGGV